MDWIKSHALQKHTNKTTEEILTDKSGRGLWFALNINIMVRASGQKSEESDCAVIY